jgi:RRXRR protein
MHHVFVVDATRRPLMPCRPARARRLLTQHRAAVLRRFPFTIMLISARPEAVVTPMRLKIDPGSRITGLALVRETEQSGEVVWAAELSHRGEQIHSTLVDRQ